MTLEEAREISARCWCEPPTSMITMNEELAEAFALALRREVNRAVERGVQEFTESLCNPHRLEYTNIYTMALARFLERKDLWR